AATTQVIEPRSSLSSRWVEPVAPTTGTPDRIHWNSYSAGGPAHVPAEHVSEPPTWGLPLIAGGTMFAGGRLPPASESNSIAPRSNADPNAGRGARPLVRMRG